MRHREHVIGYNAVAMIISQVVDRGEVPQGVDAPCGTAYIHSMRQMRPAGAVK